MMWLLGFGACLHQQKLRPGLTFLSSVQYGRSPPLLGVFTNKVSSGSRFSIVYVDCCW